MPQPRRSRRFTADMNLRRGLLTLLAVTGLLCAAAGPSVAAKPDDPRHPTAVEFSCFPTYGTGPVVPVWCSATVRDVSAEPTEPTGSILVTVSPGEGREYPLNPSEGSGTSSAGFGFSTVGGEQTVTVSYGGDVEHAPSSRSETFGVAPRYEEPITAGPLVPVTWLRPLPRRTTQHRVTFVFRSGTPRAGFECKLDRRYFSPCRSPLSRRVGTGRHRFAVRAVAPNGYVDPSPAVVRWRVVRRR